LSEYELLKQFETHEVFAFCVSEGSVALFQKHFLMMHVLYALRSTFLEGGRYLDISLGKISLKELNSASEKNAVRANIEDMKLQEYYSDIRNLYAEDESSIDAMLSGFWKEYAKYAVSIQHDYSSALRAFDLNDDYTEQDLKKQWRKLAHSEHPDRGGSAEKFIALQEAYACLKENIRA